MGRIANQPKINDLIAAGQIAPQAAAPALPGLPAIPSTDPGHAVNFRGPIADDQWDRVDAQRQWTNKTIPQQRITPPQPAQSSQSGAFVQGTVLPVMVAASAAQLAAETAQNAANQALAATFKGNWASTIAYGFGALVNYLGIIYVSQISGNTGHTPSTSPTFWVATGAETFLGAWSSSTAYVIGDIVSVGSALFIATANSLNVSPTGGVLGFWQQLTSTSIYEGAWNSGSSYATGESVSFQGNFYIATADNTNQTPAPTGSSFWVLAGTSTTLIGAYSGATAYVKGNEVTQSGNIFRALQATTGNAPPAPGSSSAFWLLVGPQTLDAVANGSVNLFGQQYSSATVSIPNNSFEASASILPPPGWVAFDGGPLAYNTSSPQSGNQSISLGPTTLGSYITQQKWACQPGDDILVGGFAKSDGVAVPNIFIFFLDKTGALNGIGGVTFTTSTSYNYMQGVATAPAGSVSFGVVFRLQQASNGTATFDNIFAWRVIALDQQISDGTTRFGQTASGLSYHPLSNPLTGHDAGANATINIAAFTMRTSSKGDISVSSGSITALSYGTGYYVYYDDPTLAGGSVTFNATTSKGTPLQGAGRFYVGSITTPLAGAIDTIGNNDGGTGVQTGATLNIISTIQTPTLGGGYGLITPISGLSSLSNASAVSEQWSGYVPQSQAPPSAITLTVTSQVAITGAGTGQTTLSYSTDGGSTFTNIYNVTANRALTTDVINITLPATPQKIVLFAQNSHTGGAGTCTSTISNILLTVQI